MYFREFLHTVPFLRLLIPLMLGIVFAEYFIVENSVIYISILISILGLFIFQLAPFLRKSYSFSFIYGIFIFILCFSVGSARIKQSNASMQLHSVNSITAFKGKIKIQPDEKPKSIACILRVEATKISDRWKSANANVLLYIAKDSLAKFLSQGDEIVVSTTLSRVSNHGNPNEFNYARYLQRKSILYSTYVNNRYWKLIARNEAVNLKSIAIGWRQKLLRIYKRVGLENEPYEILAALTLGARDEVSEDVRTVWSAAGATHVLAVSGLHVGIIFAVMQFLLSFLAGSKVGRFVRGFLLIVSLWGYALLTGLSPSVMRAASMFSILAIALIINRKGTIYNSLAISACALLLYDPFVLFDVGFQFSYLAVVSIVFFQPKLDKLLQTRSFVLRWSWKLFTVSLAAQIGTFPLAIFYFHQFPSYFFLSNFVIIPFAGLLIYASALLLIFSELDGVAKVLSFLLQHFVEFIHWLIYQIQSLPGALIEQISFSPIQVVLIYTLIITLTIALIWKRKHALFASLIILISFKILSLTNLYSNENQEMVVFNANKQTVVCIRDGNFALVLSDTILNEKQKQYLVYPYGMLKGVKRYQYDILKKNDLRLFNDKLIAIIGDDILKDQIQELNADYIILRNNALRKSQELLKVMQGEIIHDASNYRAKSGRFNKNIWDTRKSGAYCVDLGRN